MVSLPLGAVRLQQEFLREDPPGKGDIRRLKQFIDRELTRGVRKLGAPRVSLVIATSGTAAALAEATSAMMPAKGGTKKEAPRKAVRKLADKLAKMSNEQRADVPGIGPRRSEIVIGGAQVYASLLERFGLKGFR
jgi:exopolyphosphatase/guanosine-5'-triphosphate,3'-diphosphate pyrophosphatase